MSSIFSTSVAYAAAPTEVDASTVLNGGVVPILLLVVGIASLLLLAGILILLVRQKHTLLTPGKAQEVILAAEEKARGIVAEASAEARRARLSIEEVRTSALKEDHNEIEHFLEAYRFHLDKILKELSYGIEKEHLRATSHFVEALQRIEEKVAHDADEAKHSMDSFTDQSGTLFERLTLQIENVEQGIQHLAVALQEAAASESDKNALVVREEMRKIGAETARSVVEVARGLDKALRTNVEKEFSQITNELERYREARLRLVDEKILVLVEEAVQLALQKQLSTSEHSELVYKALEEAKEQGIFM